MKIDKERLRKIDRKISREIELENSNGWTSKLKPHKSIKDYSRKNKQWLKNETI
jgi:hypothetical protein